MAIHKTGLASSSISVHDYDRLIGMSKKDVIELLELSYNDINGNVWMYYLYPVFKYTKPNYLYLIFKNGKVTVKTVNPIWRNELIFQKEDLLNRLKKEEPELNIKELEFR